ncbi:MAG: DNA-processing protein DprA [Candidatus Omnitrophica bacterium]|nr:DNA-processing protein DprA [Candidatus Omnitrophota bacterium]
MNRGPVPGMSRVCYDIMALSMAPGIGPVAISRILEELKDPGEIFSLGDARMRYVLGPRSAAEPDDIRKARENTVFLKELDRMEGSGIKALCVKDAGYPGPLSNIYDAPPVLYYKGEILEADDNSVAIVGSRNCTIYGMQMAEKLARGLSEAGITVISGMAKGIDTAAHMGALRAGGRTIAVMGTGFGSLYPSGSEAVVDKISAMGAVVTEYVSDAPVRRGNFPRRNRMISGMAKGVVVVEAAARSGALITASLALEEGREVFAVPGRADSPCSVGTNSLIRNGAKLVSDVGDVIEEIWPGLPSGKCFRPVPVDRAVGPCVSSACGGSIMKALSGKGSVHVDDIAAGSGVRVQDLSETLLRMEMEGLVEQLPGRFFRVCTGTL